jgi:hypothetical protein
VNIAIPDWARTFVTATTTTDDNQTIVRYTGWRLVIDTTYARRHPNTTEADVVIVANDQEHDCACLGCAAVHGSTCPDNSANLVCMGTDLANKAAMVNEAVRLAAEQGFRVDGPWVPDTNGRLTAPLVPVILDRDCAAYEPETAEKVARLVKPEWMPELAERAARMAADLNVQGRDICPTCLSFREKGSCLNCTMAAERAAAMV